MRGAEIIAGDDHVVLDVSGSTTVARSIIPQIRALDIAAIPGAAGFDTDHLAFQMVATARN